MKASLLFLQKFTEEEKVRFEAEKTAAVGEMRRKFAPHVTKRTEELERAIDRAKVDKDAEKRKTLQAELRRYQRDMEAKIQSEARALAKSRFPYHIFLYEAEHVGITATGETDRVPNELCPGDDTPEGIEKTALELYFAFRVKPERFLTEGCGYGRT